MHDSQSLMSTQIHFVTGKGGTGKSTIASAMAHSFAAAGTKTLLVELSETSQLSKFFNAQNIGQKPVSVSANLDIAHWTGADCLKEYALHLLRVEALVRLFFENKMTKSLIEIAPALKEIAILGKITSGVRKHGPAAPHEVIVVDAYSTGHFLALLRAPKGLAEITSRGPIGEQSRSIDQAIKNPTISAFHIVALAEEMPMQETIELATQLRDELGLKPSVILNQLIQDNKLAGLQPKTEFAHFVQKISQRQALAREQLKKLKIETKEIHRVFSQNDNQIFKSCAKEFA
jgi:anion-transporting  ArsA/GET3 family ATPase